MNSPDDSAIEVHGIHKTYRISKDVSTPVLQGVDLHVRRGECVFLAGPSGSGKSTLLSILGCIMTADCGIIRLLGNDVSELDPTAQARFRRVHIGFLFQRFHLFRGLRAWENVKVPLDLMGYSRAEAKQEALRLLEAVGLSDRGHHHVTQLSIGQLQRVALARALAGDPELILADEPTASLDEQNGRMAMELLRALTAKQGKTAVVVTHDHRIFRYADRICHMQDGRIVEHVET
jgi:putative ABC transport system ATP-binding protein